MIGCKRSMIDHPPEIGSLLTIKHSDYYKNGTMRNAYFWRHINENQLDQSLQFWKANNHQILVKLNKENNE